jgi:hypothetical protein
MLLRLRFPSLFQRIARILLRLGEQYWLRLRKRRAPPIAMRVFGRRILSKEWNFLAALAQRQLTAEIA